MLSTFSVCITCSLAAKEEKKKHEMSEKVHLLAFSSTYPQLTVLLIIYQLFI